ncbi:hypothetical protein [Micromonospora sp. NBC_01796]|uniref:hypothetical protein n=1 Tax=Micromonospora sp. NBC_01796 TaxID=2975987 RepID=UPI002DDA5842|nr:hypothetical protein [Micromonospora sp. NBC_01796]WSA83238.1 hypothetical protein OIE47_22840 [Micromonospora sp. NBC_01796]
MPYQDPTPEMAEQFNREVAASNRLMKLGLAGGGVLLAGGIGLVLRTAITRRRARRT